MSLHRYDAPPPLAIAVHPAPIKAPTPPKDDKKDNFKPEGKPDGKAEKATKGKPIPGLKAPDAKEAEQKGDNQQGKNQNAEPQTPATATSMIPEPPTPAPQAEKVEDKAEEKEKQEVKEGGKVEGETTEPEADAAKDNKADQKDAESGTEKKEGSDEEQKEEKQEEPPKLEPIRLISPPPHRPVRTKLDLHPTNPYPRINTDPRGAYFKYARSMFMEQIYIDVTKDGFLFDQWKEKPEREALARLNGEAEKQMLREMEEAKRVNKVREVPDSAEGILLDLWNDLVLAPANELSTDVFWSRYDWSPPAAKMHLLDAKRKEDGEDKAIIIEGKELEWTKEGVEETLAAVGVSCGYNLEKPIHRSPYEPVVSYLILGHGHFMLRNDDFLSWKTADQAANKFEMLVTSGHDRVFGDMVMQKQMAERKKKEEEYRKKRYLEKKKAAEEEAKKKEVNGEEKKAEGEKEAKGTKKEDIASSTSVAKIKDGKEVKPTKENDEKANAKPKADAVAGEVVAVMGEDGKAVIAVPVKEGEEEKDKLEVDAKHEAEVMVAKPGDATAPSGKDKIDNKKDGKDGNNENNDNDKEKKEEKKPGNPKDKNDPLHKAEFLAKMMGTDPSNLKMDDIQLALKALEAAAAETGVPLPSLPGIMGNDLDKKDSGGPLIWTWGDKVVKHIYKPGKCEKWRWKNWELGCAVLPAGGVGAWEERDWRVFADNRGVDEFEEDQADAEIDERDIHDWNC